MNLETNLIERKSPFWDISIWSLILVNIVTMTFALIEQWSLTQTLLTFWSQSVIIGFFTALKIFSQKESQKKTLSTINFLIHYGLFHIGYLLFILAVFPLMEGSAVYHSLGIVGRFYIPNIIPNNVEIYPLLITSTLFFVNHSISFLQYRKFRQDAGRLVSTTYTRIIPIHLTIIVGTFTFFITKSPLIVLGVFFVIKGFIDVLMHIFIHKQDYSIVVKSNT